MIRSSDESEELSWTASTCGINSCGLKKWATIMTASGETERTSAEPRFSKFGFLAPGALAVGGTLSLVWAYTLGLYAYEFVCWLFA